MTLKAMSDWDVWEFRVTVVASKFNVEGHIIQRSVIEPW